MSYCHPNSTARRNGHGHGLAGRSNSLSANNGGNYTNSILNRPAPVRQPTGPPVDAGGFASGRQNTTIAYGHSGLTSGPHSSSDMMYVHGCDTMTGISDRPALGFGDGRRNNVTSTDDDMIKIIVQPILPGNLIFIQNERTRIDASPDKPSFIPPHLLTTAQNAFQIWTSNVLPVMSERTFVISSGVDLDFFHAMMRSLALPGLSRTITSIKFDKFYWFSGVNDNRMVSPELVTAIKLPSLKRLGLTFHCAGLTRSCYGERQRLQIEMENLERSKGLQVMSLEEVIKKYDLEKVFQLEGLKVLDLECHHSEMVAHYSKFADPLRVFHNLEQFFKQGFAEKGISIAVSVKVFRHEGEWPCQ